MKKRGDQVFVGGATGSEDKPMTSVQLRVTLGNSPTDLFTVLASLRAIAGFGDSFNTIPNTSRAETTAALPY
jgi:hypothetical protein